MSKYYNWLIIEMRQIFEKALILGNDYKVLFTTLGGDYSRIYGIYIYKDKIGYSAEME